MLLNFSFTPKGKSGSPPIYSSSMGRIYPEPFLTPHHQHYPIQMLSRVSTSLVPLECSHNWSTHTYRSCETTGMGTNLSTPEESRHRCIAPVFHVACLKAVKPGLTSVKWISSHQCQQVKILDWIFHCFRSAWLYWVHAIKFLAKSNFCDFLAWYSLIMSCMNLHESPVWAKKEISPSLNSLYQLNCWWNCCTWVYTNPK